MAKLRIGLSPITNVIYAGRVLKTGMWAKGKTEVTDEAIAAVSHHLLIEREGAVFKHNGKAYILEVTPLQDNVLPKD